MSNNTQAPPPQQQQAAPAATQPPAEQKPANTQEAAKSQIKPTVDVKFRDVGEEEIPLLEALEDPENRKQFIGVFSQHATKQKKEEEELKAFYEKQKEYVTKNWAEIYPVLKNSQDTGLSILGDNVDRMLTGQQPINPEAFAISAFAHSATKQSFSALESQYKQGPFVPKRNLIDMFAKRPAPPDTTQQPAPQSSNPQDNTNQPAQKQFKQESETGNLQPRRISSQLMNAMSAWENKQSPFQRTGRYVLE